MVAALLVIARPPADLAEAGAPVEPPRRLVVLVDFEKHRARAEPGEPPQMQIEQRAREPAAAARRCDRDRKDFRFAAASRDRMKPCSVRPVVARCATMLRSSSSRSNSPSLQPCRNEAACSVAIAAASRGLASDSAGSPRANRRVSIPIIGAAASRRPAAARRARADRAASARWRLRRRRPRAAPTQTMSGARRSSTSAGGSSRDGQAAASMLAPVPTIRTGPLAAARAASATLAMRGATSVRPPGPNTCR